MCFEVYAEQPVQIPYAHETIRFLGPRSFVVCYALLIRNAGYLPIRKLSLLYPRPVMQYLPPSSDASDQLGRLVLMRFRDITDELSGFEKISINGNPGLRLVLADPNNPLCDLTGLTGLWFPGNWAPRVPKAVYDRGRVCHGLFSENRFAAWHLELKNEINAGEAHWYYWEITINDAGQPLPHAFFSPVVFHEIISPINVRRTVVENLQEAIKIHRLNAKKANSAGNETGVKWAELNEAAALAILEGFRLSHERMVDIQYYELTIETGDPGRLFMLQCLPYGDIRFRSEHPRVNAAVQPGAELSTSVPIPTGSDECGLEPAYDFKSGSILEPAHPWKNTGFSVRMVLACSPDCVERGPDGVLRFRS
jgi:hypothetical protein